MFIDPYFINYEIQKKNPQLPQWIWCGGCVSEKYTNKNQQKHQCNQSLYDFNVKMYKNYLKIYSIYIEHLLKT